MNTPLKSLLLAGCVMIPSYAFADDSVFVTSLNFGGSGCTKDDTVATLYPDNDPMPDQFSLTFDNYIVFQPSTNPTDRLKNCTITAGLHIPGGYQVTIAAVSYEGSALLPKGVYGRQKSTYEFPLWSNEVTAQTVLVGPFDDGYPDFPRDYDFTDYLKIKSWSPCGIDAPLEIETQIALGGKKTPEALMQVANINGKVTQKYHLEWRRCTHSPKPYLGR